MDEELMKNSFLLFVAACVDNEESPICKDGLKAALEAFSEWQTAHNVDDAAFNELFEGPIKEYVNLWLYAAFYDGYKFGYDEGEYNGR